ncbi:hypothetical protein STAQ_39100 [Allostella sp. ATCC 35155]|nr:hypothetical protein STAQ_39100 [Stella sp. ATCC 35155]
MDGREVGGRKPEMPELPYLTLQQSQLVRGEIGHRGLNDCVAQAPEFPVGLSRMLALPRSGFAAADNGLNGRKNPAGDEGKLEIENASECDQARQPEIDGTALDS